jgi:hypothetical protein
MAIHERRLFLDIGCIREEDPVYYASVVEMTGLRLVQSWKSRAFLVFLPK